MSRNDEEFGTIVLPRTEVAGLRKRVLQAYQTHRTARLAALDTAMELARKDPKFRKDPRGVLLQIGTKYDQHSFDRFSRPDAKAQLVSDAANYIAWSRFDPHGEHRPGTKLSSWDIEGFAGWPVTAKTTDFLVDEASISFKGREVTWNVPSNNHAVERAHEHPVAQAFFQGLAAIKSWPRGTGGEILGNDEYNRDSREMGGGGNYVTARYGDAVKKDPLRKFSLSVDNSRLQSRNGVGTNQYRVRPGRTF